jgi:hypothetical protein
MVIAGAWRLTAGMGGASRSGRSSEIPGGRKRSAAVVCAAGLVNAGEYGAGLHHWLAVLPADSRRSQNA